MEIKKTLFKVSLGKLERVYKAHDENEARCLFSAEIVCNTMDTINAMCEVKHLEIPPATHNQWEQFLKSLESMSREERQQAMINYARSNQPMGAAHNEIYKRTKADTTRFYNRSGDNGSK